MILQGPKDDSISEATPETKTTTLEAGVQREKTKRMIGIPQHVDNPVDQVDNQIPKNDEQPAQQHDSQENVDATLRRSTRVRKSAIPSDYIAYLQESDYNIGAKNDSKTFDQAMSYKKSNL